MKNFKKILTSFILLTASIIHKIECAPLDGYHNQNFNTLGILETIDAHIIALRDKDIVEAYEGYTSIAYQASTSLKEFAEFVGAFAPLYDNDIITLGKVTFKENIGIYEGLIESISGEQLLITYELVMERKKWKIQFIALYEAPKQ